MNSSSGISVLKEIWTDKYPPRNARKHSLIEKLFSSFAILACMASLANLRSYSPTKIRESHAFMDLYVLGWAFALCMVLLVSAIPGWLAAAIAAYRIFDIVSYRLFFLLVKSQEKPWTEDVLRRSLLIVVVNFFEIVTGFAILYLHCGCILPTNNSLHSLDGASLAFYYSLVTMMTLGYGDYVPVNPYGRMLVIAQLTTMIVFLLFLLPGLISVFSSSLTRGSSEINK